MYVVVSCCMSERTFKLCKVVWRQILGFVVGFCPCFFCSSSANATMKGLLKSSYSFQSYHNNISGTFILNTVYSFCMSECTGMPRMLSAEL